jgi:hypothetical protein
MTLADIVPGNVLYGDSAGNGKPPAQILERAKQMQLPLQLQNDLRNQIRRAFRFSLSQVLAARPQMTAEEVQAYTSRRIEIAGAEPGPDPARARRLHPPPRAAARSHGRRDAHDRAAAAGAAARQCDADLRVAVRQGAEGRRRQRRDGLGRRQGARCSRRRRIRNGSTTSTSTASRRCCMTRSPACPRSSSIRAWSSRSARQRAQAQAQQAQLQQQEQAGGDLCRRLARRPGQDAGEGPRRQMSKNLPTKTGRAGSRIWPTSSALE